MSYNELLQTDLWRSKRSSILERDGHKCRNCGGTTHLQVHHRQYHICKVTGLRIAPWDYSAKYLVTLCESCHKAGHNQFSIPTFKK